MDNAETIYVYPTTSSGVMMLNTNILRDKIHNQIIFHQLNNNAILCEIKPFIPSDNVQKYSTNGSGIKIVNLDLTYIYFNDEYYGNIKSKCTNIKFSKVEKNGIEYGLISLVGDRKYMVLFNNQRVIFCGQYVDNEILKEDLQIYTHIPNVFNIGGLIKYNFKDDTLNFKSVCDRGEERKQINEKFNIVYFLEAIKCGRYKYAYSKLSYELKAEINSDILCKYFKPFDRYIYLHEQDVYITLNNNRIMGIYRFDIKDNMINNIY